jgi:3',5'-nucleoside bisphosphate phosphatase
MKFVDLHVHTNHSDGYDTPAAAVKMAAENGVAVMAVTDHDNLGGLEEAVAAGKREGVAVVPGVEISARFHERTIHILGLGINRENPALASFLSEVFSMRRESIISQMRAISEKFSAEGQASFSLDRFVREQGKYFNLNKAANFLVVNGFSADHSAARRLIFDAAAGKNFKASASEAIAAIHAAGGLAISAHPLAGASSLWKIDSSVEGQERLLVELKSFGIDGLECYQSAYGPEETAFGLRLAEKYGLLVSAGSDWHGAVCNEGFAMKDVKPYYPEHVGGLGLVPAQVAPLLARLGIDVDKL